MRSLRRKRFGKKMSFAKIAEELNRQGVPTWEGALAAQLPPQSNIYSDPKSEVTSQAF
jgi:hypothetical protein